MKTLRVLFSSFALLAAGGCATPSAITTAEPVRPERAAPARNGVLVAYTATERHEDGDGPAYYPHTGYLITDESGNPVRHVVNHVGSLDEQPTPVNLPAGRYVVLASRAGAGRVRIPIVIEAGRRTVLRLDGTSGGS